ncbi:MAG: hypothetical protein IKC26_00570 [Clostridia bacterium]|nr:hypothetical protein [Clostridia bacterium]
MLFKQNKAAELSDELFREPTAEYRGAPFWSWNCELDEKELLRQIDELKEMGFGGFHMHCRAGMSTEYLSEEFMKLVKSCVRKAKKEDMLAWLYDEDRWPSGFAGGIVTKDARYRGRYLVFSPDPYEVPDTTVCGEKQEKPHIDFGRFDVVLNADGTLASYRRLSDGETAVGDVFYAYVVILNDNPRYNNQAYADTLSPDAIKRFIEVTYDAYKEAVGKEFDKTVPAIFTDEPQFRKKGRLTFATDKKQIELPWTDDIEDTYRAKYGDSLIEHIPELIWDLPNGAPSVTRYHYHEHVGQRFAEAFADQCGDWCKRNKLALTGHMMAEASLGSQTGRLGEAMPSYRGFQIPGIDMLHARYELNTAKQCQSAVRQYGREGMMSELYGVTSWDFDFRGYKISGDWQTAFGVNVRVPHLAWVSMEGEAKRDYPAAIGYQSPWYKQFKYVEDHFSRLHTALTRGKPIVRVGVIHPIESYWLHFGPQEQSALATQNLESNFENIVKWLTYGGYDFDYICETTFPDLCKKGSAPLRVGEMAYDAVVVPACETLRASTVERLEAFQRAGGKLIFMGSSPKWMDAVPSDVPAALYEKSERISFSRSELLCALEEVREVEIRNNEGAYTEDMLYQMRLDGTDRWLFVCKGAFPVNKDLSMHGLVVIRVPGLYTVKLYDSLTGDIRDQRVTYRNGKTEIVVDAYGYDSFLFRLSPAVEAIEVPAIEEKAKPSRKGVHVESLVPFTCREPNALLLDQAEFALDDEPYHGREEVLRADTRCRNALGWPRLSGGAAQPWCIEKEPIVHKIRLRFRVQSEIRCFGAMLAIENPDKAEIVWNGKPIDKKVKGYYVDRSIKTLKLPVINKGENILELTLPFGKRTATEWCYILGNFGTRVMGDTAVITALPETLGFSSITSQGLSFYSGALDYHLDVTVPEEWDGSELTVRVPQYRGTVLEAEIDGGKPEIIAYMPYQVSLGKVSAGKHRVTVRLFVPRSNGFGPVHLANEKADGHNPGAWRSAGDGFGYEYRLMPEGVMMKPQLTLVK